MDGLFRPLRVIEEVQEDAVQGQRNAERRRHPHPPADSEPVEDPGGKRHLTQQRKNAGHAVEPAVVHIARQRRDPNVLGDFLGAPAFKFPSIVGSHRRHLLPERLDILCKMRHQRGAQLIPVECRSGVQ